MHGFSWQEADLTDPLPSYLLSCVSPSSLPPSSRWRQRGCDPERDEEKTLGRVRVGSWHWDGGKILKCSLDRNSAILWVLQPHWTTGGCVNIPSSPQRVPLHQHYSRPVLTRARRRLCSLSLHDQEHMLINAHSPLVLPSPPLSFS